MEPLLSTPSTEISWVFWGWGLSPQAWGNLSNLLRAQCVELYGEKGRGESNWEVKEEGVRLWAQGRGQGEMGTSDRKQGASDYQAAGSGCW